MYGEKAPLGLFSLLHRITNTSIVRKLPTKKKKKKRKIFKKTDSIKKSDNFNLVVGEWSKNYEREFYV